MARAAATALRRAIADPSTMGTKAVMHVDLCRPRRAAIHGRPGGAGRAGRVTQPQSNLIWRLWLDIDGWDGETSPAALDAAIGSMLGMEGGLASLTRAVIDRFMVPTMNDHLVVADTTI